VPDWKNVSQKYIKNRLTDIDFLTNPEGTVLKLKSVLYSDQITLLVKKWDTTIAHLLTTHNPISQEYKQQTCMPDTM